MIVPTMSYPEIYRVLENAAPKIRYKTEQLRPKAVKYFKREVWNYPAWKTFEYTIPETNDTYVIFFYEPMQVPLRSLSPGVSAFSDTGTRGK